MVLSPYEASCSKFAPIVVWYTILKVELSFFILYIKCRNDWEEGFTHMDPLEGQLGEVLLDRRHIYRLDNTSVVRSNSPRQLNLYSDSRDPLYTSNSCISCRFQSLPQEPSNLLQKLGPVWFYIGCRGLALCLAVCSTKDMVRKMAFEEGSLQTVVCKEKWELDIMLMRCDIY